MVIRLGATPVSLSLLSLQVYASSSEKETPKKELLKIEELSLYSSPARETKYVENPQTQLEEGVSHLRHVLEPYTACCQDLYAKAIPKLEKAVEHGREGFELLQNPPAGFYPRLGVIGFAGILGLFLARGSKIKKLVYPTGLMGIGASMYYPQQAVSIAKVAGTQLTTLRRRNQGKKVRRVMQMVTSPWKSMLLQMKSKPRSRTPDHLAQVK
ncbi:MICOS complex subunit MIC26 isoform A [Patagioenas fasciata monilis]|uniref:MICOS complex subunit n=1 Tax=Patagioenas fasciata monilis TaxID=372326 RepID=A0A1V4JCB7_PATFA|nr:MICOS complex subunit MIC26 isoform A [Patagioenas fasciata monilis]